MMIRLLEFKTARNYIEIMKTKEGFITRYFGVCKDGGLGMAGDWQNGLPYQKELEEGGITAEDLEKIEEMKD